jgi:hypothetical protein
MVILSQVLSEIKGKVQRLFREEVLSAYYRKEAPDPVMLMKAMGMR